MQLEQERVGAALVVRVAGSLDVDTAPVFRQRVDGWFLGSDATRLILNLSRVTFMDSTGLGAVLGRLRQAQAAGRPMALIPPAGIARSLLDTTALGRVLQLFRSERAALGEGGSLHG